MSFMIYELVANEKTVHLLEKVCLGTTGAGVSTTLGYSRGLVILQ